MTTSKLYKDNLETIGNTPLVKIQRITAGLGGHVFGKVEARNPAFSVKDRIGAALVWDAEKKGTLTKGKVIIEATSGNTGIALAFAGAARGYEVVLTMPESMTLERRKLLVALGAKLVLTPASAGMNGAVQKAEEIAAKEPEKYVLVRQFENPVNPEIHFRTTGPEIWDATEGKIDVLVSGVGTGGTITGVSRYIKKEKGKAILSVAVEPSASPIITQKRAGQPLTPGGHKIQGIGANFIPKNLDLEIVDRVEQVSNDDAIAFARRLGREEGILSGISGGAAIAVAARLAALPEFAGKNIVAILPDSGERYLTGALYEGWFDEVVTAKA